MSEKQEKAAFPGYLISFEGSEGSGKSTQIARLAKLLQDSEVEVEVLREPGGSAIGEEIRHLIKHAHCDTKLFPETELLLFAASRAQLVREKILPALEAGKIILCDRYLDSTTVYQGVARQISSDPVQMINRFAVRDLMPDLTIVLDVPADESMKRVKQRVSDLPDRMEQENIEFYERVREGYLVLAHSLPDRFVVIDGTQDRHDIEAQIWEEIQSRFFFEKEDEDEKCS